MSTEDSQYYHFAVNGKSWGALRQYFPDLIPKVTYIKLLEKLIFNMIKEGKILLLFEPYVFLNAHFITQS